MKIFSSLCVAFPAFVLSPGFLQDAPKDDNPQVVDRIKVLEESFKKKDDDSAIRAIDALTQLSANAGPKDRGKIAKAVAGAYSLRRDQHSLYKAATFSLSTLGEEGVKPLLDAAQDRTFKKPDDGLPELRAEFVKALGRTKSLKAVDPLLDFLKDKDYVVIAGASEALGHYRKADESVRKKIADKLIKLISTAEAAKLADASDNEAKLKYDTIGGTIITSLQSVTGEGFREPSEWMKFWNDAKKKSWPPLP